MPIWTLNHTTTMKNYARLFACFVFVFIISAGIYAQDYDPNQPSAFDWLDEEEEADPIQTGSPFSQGNWNFQLKRNISYKSFSGDDPDESDLGIRLKTKYFVANSFGIGLNVGYGSEKQSDEFYTNKNTNYSVQGGLTFGKSFGEFNVFIEGWGGIGQQKNTYSYSGGTDSEQTYNQIKYSGAIGFPIRLCGKPVYLTPKIGYSFFQEKEKDNDTYKYTESDLFLNAKLEFYMGCEGMFCGYADKGDMDDGRYDQGANHFVFPTFASFKMGNEKQDYNDGEGSDVEQSSSKYNVTISDYQYIINNLAIGLSGTVRGNSSEVKDADYKTTNSSYFVMPMLRGNLPVYGCFNNLFIEGGYGIGSSKTKTESGGTTTSDYKTDLTVLKGGLGMNFFVNENFGFTAGVHYQQETTKDDSDNEIKNSGFVGSIGSTIRF